MAQLSLVNMYLKTLYGASSNQALRNKSGHLSHSFLARRAVMTIHLEEAIWYHKPILLFCFSWQESTTTNQSDDQQGWI